MLISQDQLQKRVRAARTRIELKKIFHEEIGLGAAEAAAKVREIFSDAPENGKGQELTRAGVARAFREERQREQDGKDFIMLANTRVCQRKEVALEWEPLVAEVAACKTADEVEAVLVRADWEERDIAIYMEHCCVHR